MAQVRMHSPPARTVYKENQRWARQRPITRGGVSDHYVPPPPAPTLTTVAPDNGVAAGGTAVTLTGTGFTGATGATFGGAAATAFTVVSATSITCTTPAHAAGAVDVVVLHPNGNATKTGGFTYT
jgi:hypothetical protein